MKTLTPGQSSHPATADDADQRAIDTLARTMWGEARGEGSAGMEAVAAVILNRVAVARAHGKFWWGNDVVSVCRKPYQFSCWNASDPNLGKLQSITDRDIYFMTALRIARRAMIGMVKDPTMGATHYHRAGITPFWAVRAKPCAVIGQHIFYRLEA